MFVMYILPRYDQHAEGYVRNIKQCTVLTRVYVSRHMYVRAKPYSLGRHGGTSALEVFFNDMRYINSHFAYFTYLL